MTKIRRVTATSVALALAAALFTACGDDAADGDDGAGSGGSGAGSGGSGTGAIGIDAGNGMGGDDGTGGVPECGESPFEAGQIPVHVLLVIDQSQSMVDNDIGSVTRWDAMVDAVGAALGETQDSLSYGLKLFPGAPQCDVAAGVDVDVAPGTDSSADILDALDGTSPDGGTPTAAALQRALEYFTEGAGDDLDGEKYVLLATDGGPNCDESLTCAQSECTLTIDGTCPGTNCCEQEPSGCLDEDGAVGAVTALAEAGIKTIVVGIPGTEEYEATLSAMADAGGVPNTAGGVSYYAVDEDGGAQGLADALIAITESLITTCEFKLASEPPRRSLLNVEIDGVKIPRLEGGGDEGWDYAPGDESPPTVVLLGSTCEQVETEGAQSVSIVYGCPTEVPK